MYKILESLIKKGCQFIKNQHPSSYIRSIYATLKLLYTLKSSKEPPHYALVPAYKHNHPGI